MLASNLLRRALALSVLLVLAGLLVAGCGGQDSGDSGSGGDDAAQEDGAGDEDAGGGGGDEVAERDGMYDEPPTKELDPSKQYVVRMETTKGTFDIEVDPKAAPIAAANFVFLVEEGYYDGIVFHRVIKDFMVQTGDPTGTGMGGPGYELEDDPVKGDYSRGTVAMANAGPDTGGSQFFIVHGTAVDLPKNYVIFGRVDEEGMEVVDEIAEVEVTDAPSGEANSQPVEEVRIERATLVSPED